MFKGKKIIIGLLVASVLCLTASAFAEDVTTVVGAGKLVIGTAAGANDLTIGLSKGVEVRYINPGTDASLAQWYAVSSVHSGGNQGYATAQNLTNIMKRDYLPGSATSTVLTTIPEVSASKEEWVTMGWSAQ